MAVRIRLSRTGKKNAPSFRIVAVDSRRSRNGRPLEILGHFNPSHNPPTFSFDKKKLEFWKSQGAKMSKAVERLIAGEYEFKPYEPKRKEKKSESE